MAKDVEKEGLGRCACVRRCGQLMNVNKMTRTSASSLSLFLSAHPSFSIIIATPIAAHHPHQHQHLPHLLFAGLCRFRYSSKDANIDCFPHPFSIWIHTGFDSNIIILRPGEVSDSHIVHGIEDEELRIELNHQTVIDLSVFKSIQLPQGAATAPYLNISLSGSLNLVCYNNEAESTEAGHVAVQELMDKMKAWISGAPIMDLPGKTTDPLDKEKRALTAVKGGVAATVKVLGSDQAPRSVSELVATMELGWKNIEEALKTDYDRPHDFVNELSSALSYLERSHRAFPVKVEKRLLKEEEESNMRYTALWESSKVPSEESMASAMDEMFAFDELHKKM
ncbi:hypothetical protein BC829DRAFT_380417, partial [Chytridium lagenaria]